MKYILILAALVPLAGCVTKSTMLKNMNEQKTALENKHQSELQFNLAVQESLIVEQCQLALDRQQLSWEVGFCLHDRRMANALAKAYGGTPRYIPQCQKILKDIKEQGKRQEPAPTPAKDYSSGKR